MIELLCCGMHDTFQSQECHIFGGAPGVSRSSHNPCWKSTNQLKRLDQSQSWQATTGTSSFRMARSSLELTNAFQYVLAFPIGTADSSLVSNSLQRKIRCKQRKMIDSNCTTLTQQASGKKLGGSEQQREYTR